MAGGGYWFYLLFYFGAGSFCYEKHLGSNFGSSIDAFGIWNILEGVVHANADE